MTEDQGRPDINGRRRVRHLRNELGLGSVPTHVGAECIVMAPLIPAQVETRLQRELPRYAALSSDAQLRLIRAVRRCVKEFTMIVADTPLATPTVDVMLAAVLANSEHPERCAIALHTALEALRSAARESWNDLPDVRAYRRQLDRALARYVESVAHRALSGFAASSAGPYRGLRGDEARHGGFFAAVDRRWPDEPVWLRVSTASAEDRRPTPPSSPLPPLAGDRREGSNALRLVTDDHVLVVTADPSCTPRRPGQHPASKTPGTIVIWLGPVSAADVEGTYAGGLLMLRLVEAGVAAPPPSVVIPAPDLGFLRPMPSGLAIKRITELLGPLTDESVHRRATLARTLHLRLRTAASGQALADHLGLHPQSVRNHLIALRTRYDNPDLDFGAATLQMQAALELVLPLWELEAAGRPGPPTSGPRGRRSRRKPPPQPGELA